MHEPFYENKNIIVADFDYQAALFLFKNKHPDLDIKIISRHELINKVSYSFSKDPIPFLMQEGIGYKKAKKYLDIILTADVSKNKELTDLFNKLNDNGYLVKDEYGLYELKGSHIFLFEMEQDIAIQEFLKRNALAYSFLRLEGLDLYKNNAYISPNIIYFENKMTQFFYIFSWVRDKARDNPNQKQRIIINGDEDIFYVKIMSELFHIPVCYVEERPLISVVVTWFIIFRLYYKKSKHREFCFTFMLISIAIFFIVFFMVFVLEDMKGKTSMGIGIGLFGIFSIMRYRTDAMPVREMTYLFVIIALALVNAIAEGVPMFELILTNIIILAAVWIFETTLKTLPTKYIQYDRMELIQPERREELKADLEKRLGVKVIKVEVGSIDFIRDMAMVRIVYEGLQTPANQKLKLKNSELTDF